jgi:DNA polymerase-4
MNRHIIHIHIPAFLIAVKRVSEPPLRGRPVAVAPPRSERALIFSASHEAREQGIFRGMPLVKARGVCPDLTVLPPDPELTEKAFKVLARVGSQYTPLWEPSRPGHLYLDVTGTERLWGKAKDTARRIRQEIADRLGLQGDLGVACNKMVSSIASRIAPCPGILDIRQGAEPVFMAPMKIGVIPGIHRFHRDLLLEELNITLVRELAALDGGSLKLIFGRRAHLIHDRALGIDPTPVYPASERPMVSEEALLPEDENDDQRLLSVLYGLVEQGSRRLRERRTYPREAGILIRYSDQEEVKRRARFPRPSFWDFDLYPPIETLFLKACTRRVRIRFMKIWFQDLSPEDGQLCLFDAPVPDLEKKARMIRALDQVRNRHGVSGIAYGRCLPAVPAIPTVRAGSTCDPIATTGCLWPMNRNYRLLLQERGS